VPSGAAPPREPVFRARGLRKVYDTGAVRIEALRGVDHLDALSCVSRECAMPYETISDSLELANRPLPR